MRRLLMLSMLLVIAGGVGSARAEVPAFTPNVVDPSHHLDDAAVAQVDDLLAEMRRQAGIAGAVYVTDSLGDQSVEELAHEAFDTWHLGEAGKDNGLLLVLAMNEHRMRFEVGYGLEGALTDLVCRHALDDFVRPQMRAGDVKQAVLDGLAAVTRAKQADFKAGNVHYSPPSQDGSQAFAAAPAAWVWSGYVVLIVALFAWRRVVRSAWFVLAFLVVNPGVFVFLGVGYLWPNRAAHLAELHAYLSGDTVHAWLRANAVLVPFFVAVVIAVVYPVHRYVPRAVDLETALLDGNPELRELDERFSKIFHVKRLARGDLLHWEIAAGLAVPIVLIVGGLLFDVSYRSPFVLVGIPVVLFGLVSQLASLGLRRYASPAAYRAYLERVIRLETDRMDGLVKRGFATRSDDGTYAYTAAYYASQSSSSSSSSSFSSSSGGGSSGGGGASSSW